MKKTYEVTRKLKMKFLYHQIIWKIWNPKTQNKLTLDEIKQIMLKHYPNFTNLDVEEAVTAMKTDGYLREVSSVLSG